MPLTRRRTCEAETTSRPLRRQQLWFGFPANEGQNKKRNSSIAQQDVMISERNPSVCTLDSHSPNRQQNIGDSMHSQLRECTAFDASEVEAMGQAFDAACATLQLSDGEDAFRKLVACKVIECAESGERNPQRIYDLVLSEFRRSRH